MGALAMVISCGEDITLFSSPLILASSTMRATTIKRNEDKEALVENIGEQVQVASRTQIQNKRKEGGGDVKSNS
jgi:hypothetical protein